MPAVETRRPALGLRLRAIVLIDDTPARPLSETRLTAVCHAPRQVLPGPGGRPGVLPVYPLLDAESHPEEPMSLDEPRRRLLPAPRLSRLA